jgi:uncharacterized protein
METLTEIFSTFLFSGWLSLLDYLAAHVLLCLVPAFILAGFMDTQIPTDAIMKWLGPKAPKWISYPVASFGGFILAVCSCTILPLFAGIWKRGAGLGPAVTFLFVGPAINILALTYTGAALGMDIAIARLVLSIIFGILIGIIMSWIFRKEEAGRSAQADAGGFEEANGMGKPVIWVLFALLFGVLIAGTLQIDLLKNNYLQLVFPFTQSGGFWNFLTASNLSLQGAALILLLMLIGILAWKGFEKIHEGFNKWTWAALTAVLITILVAALVETREPGMLTIGLPGRFFAVLILLGISILLISKSFDRDNITEWIWDTWKFVKQIFPLLIVGVFVAGGVKTFIPEVWVRSIAGENTVLANFVGVIFGVFMYFPTLVEVPIAKMFLDLGMARGPLLAYLLSDPELSLQSIMVLNRIMKSKKTWVYVILVAILSTLAGLIFGYVDATILR